MSSGSKAAMDAIAVSYAGELVRFGIDTSIVVPGVYTMGTHHFAHAGTPADTNRAARYDANYGTLMEEVNARLFALILKTLTPARSRTSSSGLWTCRLASVLSGSTSTPRATVAKLSRPSPRCHRHQVGDRAVPTA